MFSDREFDGTPMTRDYAARRIRWEPIHEVTQMKGDEETHPLLSPDDEFADFERWDVGNISGSAPKAPEMLQFEYARSALRLGLKLGRRARREPLQARDECLDRHPYRALDLARGELFRQDGLTRSPPRTGSTRRSFPPPIRRFASSPPRNRPPGMTAVWTRENSREAIFDALTRKEVYATTGTRIRVRVFGGWDFTADDVAAPDLVAQRLPQRRADGRRSARRAAPARRPSFMVQALRDPDGANLDRVQIIKGWLDAERRNPRADLRRRRLGRPRNRRGRSRPRAGRHDGRHPDGDLHQRDRRGVVRGLLERSGLRSRRGRLLLRPGPGNSRRRVGRPTTRRSSVSPCPDNVPPTLQDRAYTSPIWYTSG